MNQNNQNIDSSYSNIRIQERQQIIAILKAPIIQMGINVFTPSQQRVSEREKIRKEEMKEREAKFDKYNRPKGERAEQESEEKKLEREINLNENSRPIG
jgi:hypothetical protein